MPVCNHVQQSARRLAISADLAPKCLRCDAGTSNRKVPLAVWVAGCAMAGSCTHAFLSGQQTSASSCDGPSSTRDLLPDLAPGGACKSGRGVADRGLIAAQCVATGETLLRDEAVAHSALSPEAIAAVFRAEVPAKERQLWAIVAHFAVQAAERGEGETVVGRFFRPGGAAGAPEGSVYWAHARYLRGVMREEYAQAVSEAALAEFLYIVRLNAHHVRGGGQRLDMGLFFWLHLANHSCAPNAAFTGSASDAGAASISLVALAGVEAGEEVFISYVDGAKLLRPVRERRRVLKRDFGFACECARCRQEAAAAAVRLATE